METINTALRPDDSPKTVQYKIEGAATLQERRLEQKSKLNVEHKFINPEIPRSLDPRPEPMTYLREAAEKPRHGVTCFEFAQLDGAAQCESR